jgi:hypothetical protein
MVLHIFSRLKPGRSPWSIRYSQHLLSGNLRRLFLQALKAICLDKPH